MCNHKAPHRPWLPAPKYKDLYADHKFSYPETFNDDYDTRSPAASSGIARIYFKDADKTWYEEGNDVITTITFSEDKIKEALKDDFSDLKKGTTIYLHSIFQSYRYEDVNGVNT